MDFTYLNDENNDQPKVNLINFERRQRQLLNELAMKRAQVEELKRELEASNLKTHEITRSLDSAKSTLAEQEYNLNLALKNARFFENQLQSKRDSITKARLQQESAVAESKGLKELLHKAELQNYNLTRELNEMKAQHSCDVAYQKELMNQDNKIRAKIAQLTEAVKQCQSSLSESQQLSEKIKLCEDAQKNASFYQEQFYEYKEKYVKLQEKYLFANAAVESFQRLAMENHHLFHAGQEVDVILKQVSFTTASYITVMV
ncbi:hypothetical protein ILUMI_24289 [Ignelater luminosus]|uniref:Uncharacterized protein n=1 Tax=Ignelater luminosus TaxID=2038154 RepID=A0A8K0C9E3_IGNLU|nr:hypothetical protein ILUMI_24289 [Ignelater luminosus]